MAKRQQETQKVQNAQDEQVEDKKVESTKTEDKPIQDKKPDNSKKEPADKSGDNVPDFIKDAEVPEKTQSKEKKEEKKADDKPAQKEPPKAKVEDLPNAHDLVGKEQPAGDRNIDEINKKLSPSGQIQLAHLLDYMENMKPKMPVDMKVGAAHQARFCYLLKNTMERVPKEDFDILWPLYLDLFEEHKDGVFSEDRIFRFAEEWPLSESDRMLFRRTLNLMCVTRKASIRTKSVSQVNSWGYIFEYHSEEARRRLEDFYRL